MRLLILGGTTEATRLAAALAGRPGIDPLLSLAGRTVAPSWSPLPQRSGGFGGVDGLAAFLHTEKIEAVVDATHPFAARISANAVAACDKCGIPLVAYTRAPWAAEIGDQWTTVPDIAGVVSYLAEQAARAVFVTTGRLDLAAYRTAPQHTYLVRTIDPPEPADRPPHCTVVCARGPFQADDEIALMRAHAIALLVSKNSGGEASGAKLMAARHLGLPVLMVERPALPARTELHELADVLAWIDAHAAPP